MRGSESRSPAEPASWASNLNFVEGVNGVNDIVVSLDDDGRVCVFASTDPHLTLDATAATVPV